MKFDLPPISIDTIFLALQLQQAAAANAAHEMRQQLQPADSEPTATPTGNPYPKNVQPPTDNPPT